MPAATARRENARNMTPEEIANMRAAGPLLPSAIPEELTEAAAALLVAKGAPIAISDMAGAFDELAPDSIDEGATLFRYGKGDDQFTGKISHRTGDREKLFLWNPRSGARVMLPKAHLVYYVVEKGFLVEPPPGARLPQIKCQSLYPDPSTGIVCKKMLRTKGDVERHMRKCHSDEYRERKETAEQLRAERMDAILESLANGQSKGNTDLAVVLAAIQNVNMSGGIGGDDGLAPGEGTIDQEEAEMQEIVKQSAVNKRTAAVPKNEVEQYIADSTKTEPE